MNKSADRVYIPDEMTDAATFDEAAAVMDARAGDQAAFGALVTAYQRKAYAVAYSLVGNREDALELAQEAFARAYKAMRRFDATMPFYPWLYRIVKNTCLNHLRKRARHGETSLEGLAESGYEPMAANGDPEQSADLGELRLAIAGAMQRLSPEHREILMLRHFQDLSYAEIAACLGVAPGTVMSRLHAARRGLRKELEGML